MKRDKGPSSEQLALAAGLALRTGTTFKELVPELRKFHSNWLGGFRRVETWPNQPDWNAERVFGPTALFGKLWSGHWLAHPPLVRAFSPSEPQLIAELAYYLRASAANTYCFAKSLFLARGQVPSDFTLDEFSACDIEAEISLSALPRFLGTLQMEQPAKDGQNRIDLVIKTPKRLLVIEAKFGHTVTEGQLNSIEKALERCDARADRFLVYPGSRPKLQNENTEKELAGWTLARWQNTLRHFDRSLASDIGPSEHDNTDFARLRRQLWDKAISCDGGRLR